MKFGREDRKRLCASYAAHALYRARQAANPEDRATWENIAEFWRDLEGYGAREPALFGRRYRLSQDQCDRVMPADGGAPSQFALSICCQKCGQSGTETWELVAQHPGGGLDAQFVARSGEFYERISKRAPYAIEVVCRRCEAVLKP